MNNPRNYFNDGLRVFIDYIDRQFKKNPDYEPHPLIRAFACANQGMASLEIGKCSVGVSQSSDDPNVGEVYLVVIEKGDEVFSVKEIRQMGLDRPVSIEQMISIFRLQIHLDRLESEEIPVETAISALNEVVTTPKFQSVGERWTEARDEFVSALKAERVHIPDDPELRDGLLKITKDMNWYDYPRKVRKLMGSFFELLEQDEGLVINVTFPKDGRVSKGIVFHLLTQHWWMRYENEAIEEKNERNNVI